jgi:hypothetical protein
MSSPLFTSEFADNDPETPDNLYVGDVRDDDAQVLDSFFIETDAPATPILEPIKSTPLRETPPETRILADTRVINVGDQPFRLLPADPNRKSFKIVMVTPTGSATQFDYINLSDNVGNVSQALNTGSGSGCTRVRAWAADWTLDGHTGPVWVSGSNGQTLPLEISWMAVTL